MKVAVLNFSGNVGKSTIALHLLSPRMADAPIVSIETINSDAASEKQIKGADFGKLQEDLQLVNSALVDVGASNIEQFLALMKQYHGSHEDFDLYLVPCTPPLKQQRDTIECIVQLSQMGVPAHKIFVVFNLVEPGQDVDTVFQPIMRFADDLHLCITDPLAVVYKNDVFSLVRNSGQTLAKVAQTSDATALKKAINETNDQDEKMKLAHELSILRLAVGVNKNLDEVFERVQACLAG